MTSHKIQHCIFVDGDFDRHELFSNVHPYTLNRLAKLNDVLTCKLHNEQVMKLMNNPSNIHFYICYNSSSTDIDHYYKILKVTYPQSIRLYSSINTAINDWQHKCDHIWIIHGIENTYEELIEQLKFNKKTQANISSYSWLENIKEGSNRIEYLINNKMQNFNDNQIEESNIEVTTTTTMMSTTEKPKKSNRRQLIKCDVDNCKKQFKNADALRSHQLAKHPTSQVVVQHEITKKISIQTSIQQKIHGYKNKHVDVNVLPDHLSANYPVDPVITDDETSETSITEYYKETNNKINIKCNIDGCKKKFWNEDALYNHQSIMHVSDQTDTDDEISSVSSSKNRENIITIRKHECGFENCTISCKKRRSLYIHIIERHSIPLQCPWSSNCKQSNKNYFGILLLQNHIISEHTDSTIQCKCPIPRCINSRNWEDWSTLLQHIILRHTENLFTQVYWDEIILKRHQAYEHPLPLLCPFGSECQQSTKKYFGIWKLREHVYSKHAPLYSQPVCFNSECQYNKPFVTWNHVLKHILHMHLEAVVLIVNSNTSSTVKKDKVYKKCSYQNCNQPFKTRNTFQYHLATSRPYPLRCPYNSACNKLDNDSKHYLGLMELQRHIEVTHSVQFLVPMCFNHRCQQNKHYKELKPLMNHILQKHWLNIRVK
ncbi:unnamed protein product [Adineta steineri]|uniref:C2H2-type domain-containing protein n=1 Tax=Adineta steineri TaxID=433720 RepID=A0A813WET5_9BILA|nr:unnamed protein product [Adineta steineri]CAF1489408.1 unnamed protein product [Adineta steineri]